MSSCVMSSPSSCSGLLSMTAVATDASGDSVGDNSIGIWKGEAGGCRLAVVPCVAWSEASLGLTEESSPVSGVTSCGSGAVGAGGVAGLISASVCASIFFSGRSVAFGSVAGAVVSAESVVTCFECIVTSGGGTVDA